MLINQRSVVRSLEVPGIAHHRTSPAAVGRLLLKWWAAWKDCEQFVDSFIEKTEGVVFQLQFLKNRDTT